MTSIARHPAGAIDPVILSRIQFAFVVSLHFLFPAFTIGLAAIAETRLATELSKR